MFPFCAKETFRNKELFEVSVATLFGEEKNSFTVVTQNGGSFGQYVSLPEKLIEQYELRLKEKDELIALLMSKER